MNMNRRLFSGVPRQPLKGDGHLSDDWLLFSIDGALSASDHARVKGHVRACWTCRARREQLENTIREIVEYQHALVGPDMPPSAGGRSIFMARLNQLAGELGRPSLLRRWAMTLLQASRSTLSSRVAWVTSAGLTAVFVLYLAFDHRTPVVSASELLQRAAASRESPVTGINRPVAVQKLTIKMGGRRIIRTLYRDNIRKRRAYRTDVSAQEESKLEQDFERSSFTWNDPLSPQAYSQWRDVIVEKKDVITELSGGLLRLDTSASSGPVAEASLTVRLTDYHPVAEDLRLRDNTQIEVAELSYDVVGLSALAPDVFDPVSAPEPVKLPATSSTSSGHAMPQDSAQIAASELQVRTILHRLGADLGEQITILPTPNGVIRVDGIAEDETRKRQITSALAGIQYTQLRITTVGQAAVHPSPGRSLTTSNSATLVTANPPLLEEQLEKRFPGSDQRTAYVNQSLSLCQSASARAWALNRLADRYTPQQIALLDPDAQRQLQSLLIDHATALREDISRLQNQLGQVLSSASNTAAANTVSSAAVSNPFDDWRSRAHRVHSSVEITNEAVSVLLAGSPETNDSPDKLQLRLRTTLTQLQAELQSLDQQIHRQF